MSLLFSTSTDLSKELSNDRKPLSGQLLKWVGNKQKYAELIIGYFPQKFNCYFEPFLGSGAVLATLSPEKGIGSDIFKPLIEIFQTLKEAPEQLIDFYSENYLLINTLGKEKAYETIKGSYNKKPNAKDLLFLSRACYGGVVRFRKMDGFMSTPCGVHEPISPESFTKRVYSWYDRIKQIEFLHSDYKEIFKIAKKGDLIYCDPPYIDSQAILYGAQEFSIQELYGYIEKAKAKGVYVALSLDGSKKSGSKVVNVQYPKDLFLREIPILNGRSMLKRFQMVGQSLEEEIVTERLLLTYKP